MRNEMSLGIPLKEATSWMVYKGHSSSFPSSRADCKQSLASPLPPNPSASPSSGQGGVSVPRLRRDSSRRDQLGLAEKRTKSRRPGGKRLRTSRLFILVGAQ